MTTATSSKTAIKPLEDRIVVRPLEAEQTTASGLVIPDTAKEKPQEGEVLAVGAGRFDDSGKRIRHVRAGGFTAARYFYGAATWLQQATFFRRDAYHAVNGFNVNNRSCWDGELLVDMIRHGAKVRYLNQDLALFRIHPQSITGSRRHKEMMKADAQRMFSLSSGRRWTVLDALRVYFFRIERILTHPGAVESAIRSRIRRI